MHEYMYFAQDNKQIKCTTPYAFILTRTGEVRIDIPAAERPRRSCTNTKKNYNDSDDEDMPFLMSDLDGSDFSSSEESDEENEDYDAASTSAKFDFKRGEDKWIGRRICKVFGVHDEFEGIVYGVDVDENKPDHRLFLVHYFEDPDDGESM